jgi:hypothetical protein
MHYIVDSYSMLQRAPDPQHSNRSAHPLVLIADLLSAFAEHTASAALSVLNELL